ncbi:MAG: hypothetical protein V2I43_20660 [Parvularcula sp.]|nr:hypothetical protein [Parvularcula sp.]
MSHSNLIILEDYPTTLNLTTLSGTIERIDGCILISHADGSVFLPLFRPGDTLDQIEASLGPLDQPKPVTVSSFNRMEKLPADLVAELNRRGCDGTPIAFGTLSKGEWAPNPPAVGATNKGHAENRSPSLPD